METVSLAADDGVIPEMNESGKCEHPLTIQTEGGHNVMGAWECSDQVEVEPYLINPMGAGGGCGGEREEIHGWLLSPPHPTSPLLPPNAQTEPGTGGQKRLGKAAAGVSALQYRAEQRKG